MFVGMGVVYDEAKRRATLDARDLDFAHAGAIFEGPTFTVRDDRVEYGEARYITYGMMDDRQVVVVWTWRGAHRRIISLRKANDREQARFARRMA